MTSSPRQQSGIYVEIIIRQDLARIWQLTQEPKLHERWDLRFTRIQYLPRPGPDEPQQFLYETRIGFGMYIAGTGENVGVRASADDRTSSLKFASADPKSLIRTGSGYWRYIATGNGVRFFTWYDYDVRFGALGRLIDRTLFRPLMGWATAWSFDRLRIWAEEDQSPESSLRLSLIHAAARIAIAFVWIWHGMVPKLLYRHADELTMLAQSRLPSSLLPWIGSGEILVGLLTLATWRRRSVLTANAAVMTMATIVVAINSPEFLSSAFNPVTLNLAMVAISIMGWLASQNLPTASKCVREGPQREL